MRRAVVILTTLLALVAGGQAVAEEGDESAGAEGGTTLQGQSSEWDAEDDGSTCIDGFAAEGLAIEDASLDVPPPQFDAYDDAFMLFVDGVPYNPPGVSFDSTSVDGDPQGLSGLLVSSSYRTFADSDVLRQLSSFTNVDESPKTVTVGWAHDLGSDGNTVEEATSDGDTTVEAGDLWLVSSDGGDNPDPRLSFVMAGADDPATASTPQRAVDIPTSCLQFADDLGFLYELTVPAQATCSLLHFGELTPGDLSVPIPSPDDPEAAAEEVTGESILSAADSADALSQTTGSSAIVSDLDPAVRAGVVNFDLGERADGTCVEPAVVPDDDTPPSGPVPASPAFTG